MVFNTEIWEYAEALVGDYKPQLLKEPGKVNAIHFLESYLGATVEFQDIYFEEGESPIAGATVFNDDLIRVFDREGLCTRTIAVKANTIIIDNATVENGKEGFANFTGLHEGGHFCIHPEVYRRDANQLSFFEPTRESVNVVCCRKNTMDRVYGGGHRLNPYQMREHQANVFAAFVAMPRQTFIPYAQELIRKEGFSEGIFVFNEFVGWEEWDRHDKVCGILAETYGVSFTAAKIHLRQLGLQMSQYEYDEPRSQVSVNF